LIGCAVGFLLYTIYDTVEGALQSSEPYPSPEKAPKVYSQTLGSQWDLQWNKATGKQSRSQPRHDYFGATSAKEPTKFSDLYSAWESSSQRFPSTKDTALISTTILEEEDDNYDVEY
jgi:hypothetical protein